MTTAAKAIAGVCSICAIAPTSYAVYSALSSSNSTGRKGLEDSGYSLEPPKLSSNGIDNQYGCADRLFKKMKNPDLNPKNSDTKVYGCALMRLETSSDGNKFSSFRSNIAIRKGDKGWIINVSVSSMGIIDYVYIELTYSNNEWTQEFWRWTENNASSATANQLIIKVPGNNSDWFNGKIAPNNNVSSTDTKAIKEFNKSWISDNNGSQKWILQGMMVAEGSEDKSQIFCSGETTEIDKCFQNLETTNKARKGVSEFRGAKQTGSSTSENTDIPKEKIKTTYKTLSSSQGSWTELSEICNYGKDGNINEDQQKKLEMFCAIVPPKVNTGSLPPMPVPPPVKSVYA